MRKEEVRFLTYPTFIMPKKSFVSRHFCFLLCALALPLCVCAGIHPGAARGGRGGRARGRRAGRLRYFRTRRPPAGGSADRPDTILPRRTRSIACGLQRRQQLWPGVWESHFPNLDALCTACALPFTEVLADIEEAAGQGLSNSVGLAGYTNLDVVRIPGEGSNPEFRTLPFARDCPRGDRA